MSLHDILSKFKEMFPSYAGIIQETEQTNTDEIAILFTDGLRYRFGFRGSNEIYFERIKEVI